MSSNIQLGEVVAGTHVLAASIADGRKRLTAKDAFIDNQSNFDRQARVNLRQSVVHVSEAIYSDYVSSQVMEWSPSEIEALTKVIGSIKEKMADLALHFSEQIVLVKTSGLEEGYAAYTRGIDTIVLPANYVGSLETAISYGDPLHPAKDQAFLENVIIHEMFHLFSKNNPDVRRELYGMIEYQVLENAVELPDVPWGDSRMPALKITNPDTPTMNVAIRLQVPAVPGKHDGATVKKQLLPVLLAKETYKGGIFFDYLQWWFFAVQQSDDGWICELNDDGQPLMYEVDQELLKRYYRLVGRNFTNEVFHPDEILAQSFVDVVNQPSMDLLAKISDRLTK